MTVRGATIVGTGHYAPEQVLTNHDLERMVDTSDEWIRDRTGIVERRIAAPEQSSSDLAVLREAPAADAAKQPSRFDIYATVRLTADLSQLDENQKRMVGLLIEASKIMDELFWQQAWGDKEALLSGIQDPAARRFADINYGPWDRLAGDQPLLESHGPKPPGARFYPEDMTKEEFEAWAQEGKDGLYSLVRRDTGGKLVLQPYSEAFQPQLEQAAKLLRQAADLPGDPELDLFWSLVFSGDRGEKRATALGGMPVLIQDVERGL